jgi:predicted acyltransferase
MSSPTLQAPRERVLSIDALRGFDMFWIIGGGGVVASFFEWARLPFSDFVIRQLEHSSWNGFTFEDLIFPLFLFIAGLSIPFSLGKRIQRGDSRASLYRHIFRRFAILFLLGLVYNGILGFNFGDMRYAGVLQRIALCSLFASIIFIHNGIRGQAIWAGAILLFYWAIMMLVPVPGFGAGALTPEGNLASFIDRSFLPGRFCCFEFGDNEGILSTIPAISTALMGVLAGHWLRSGRNPQTKTLGLLGAGCASLVLALLWNFVFPINKLVWTSSYVLFAGGWSLLFLAVFFWIIDAKGYRAWAFPFVVVGMNAITIYIAGDLFDFGSVAQVFIHGFVDYLGGFKPLFAAAAVLTVKWLFLWFLYRQKIFLKA